jgi:hypothetical protein
LAIAHKILVAVFHMLQRAVTFADLGADYLDRLDKHRTAKRLIRRLNALGYEVMLQPRRRRDPCCRAAASRARAAGTNFRASRHSA